MPGWRVAATFARSARLYGRYWTLAAQVSIHIGPHNIVVVWTTRFYKKWMLLDYEAIDTGEAEV